MKDQKHHINNKFDFNNILIISLAKMGMKILLKICYEWI